ANDLSRDGRVLAYARGALDAFGPNAMVIGGGDNAYFPLTYVHYVEGRRPDVVLAGFFDLITPARIRGTDLLGRAGVTVRIPPGSRVPRGGRWWSMAWLRTRRADNVGRRPVYSLGEPARLLPNRFVREVVAPYARTAVAGLPAVELTPDPKVV